MSARALAAAVVARLRSAAVLDDPAGAVCAARPTGKPPPGCGQRFYAVHWAASRERGDHTTAEHTDCDHAVTVTITARLGVAPDDRRFKAITDAGDLVDLAERIAAPGVVHGNYAEVLAAANALIPGFGVTTNGFVEPLWLLGYGPVVEQGPGWVGARDGKDVYSIDVRFGRARRLAVG